MSNEGISFPCEPRHNLHPAHVYLEQVYFLRALGAFRAQAENDSNVDSYAREEIKFLRPRYLSNAAALRKALGKTGIVGEFLRKSLEDKSLPLSKDERKTILSIPDEPFHSRTLPESTNLPAPILFYQRYISERYGLYKIFPKITSEIQRLRTDERLGYELPPGALMFTFDDGPSEKTPRILAILSEYKIRGTFFVLGKNVAGLENTVREALRRGNEIGHHAWSHRPLPSLSDKELSEEFEKTRVILKTCIADSPAFFRAPYGQRDLRTLAIADAGGEKHVLWNIDSRDWNGALSDKAVAERVLRLSLLNDGGIILFHDTLSRAERILPAVLSFFRQEGMTFQ